jgi:hypothetical protein
MFSYVWVVRLMCVTKLLMLQDYMVKLIDVSLRFIWIYMCQMLVYMLSKKMR